MFTNSRVPLDRPDRWMAISPMDAILRNMNATADIFAAAELETMAMHQSATTVLSMTRIGSRMSMCPAITRDGPLSGRFRRHRIGNDISIQRRPSLRPLRHQLQQQQQHQKEQDQISHQPPRIQPETLQRRQLSLRYMRYLSTKPLPVLLRSISMSRKRSIGPTTTASSRHFGSNLLNKPLPPIPNATNPCIGGFPSNKECAYDLFAPQDGYHEARSTMVDPHHDQVHCFGGSKQELSSLLLQEGQGRPKEAIDSTMTGKHQHYGDYHLLTDRSESKEELIGTIALGIPSTMSKEDLLSGAQRDKAEINGDNSKQQTAEEKEEAGADTTLESRTKTTTDSTLSSSTNPSPTSVAALSLKRLESFRFPLRKSLIEKCSMASPRLHHHNHHHSLPHNTTIITYAHRLSKAANDANHLPLIASDLVRQSHPTRGPTSHTNTILTTVAATSTATTDRLGTEPGQDTIDANSASLPPTGAQEKESSTVRKHDSGWVSERHRRQIGQQRLLRWSESCSNISYHRTSLSFNSSKKALLSLQARRVNKPDAKVHLLPEILTITTIPTSGSSIPVLRGINSQSEDDEEGALSGLETVRITTTPIGVTEPVLRTTPNANTNIIATAGMASAAVDSPQDNTDYQLRVSGMDRVVVDTVLTELTAAQAFKSEAIGKSVMSSEGNGKSSAAVAYTDTSVHREGAVNEQGFNLSEAVGSRSTSGERVPPSSEADLTTVLDVFKIESGPMIDAGEIKRFVKRSHALQELESTEQSYVNDLDILYHVHLRVLETKSWFPQDVHANIRRCVISLLALHHSFLAQLQAYNTSETDREKRAPLNVYRTLELSFQALSRDHRLYSNFCELRMRTVNEINRTAGQATMAGLQKESKELIAQQGRPKSRTDLKDHLIKPIQRICRYPLLLKEILRLTSPNDPEYHFIDRAHECMKAMAQQMDETQRMVERKLLTEQFLKKLPETNFPRKSSITPLNPANSFSYSNSIGNHHHYYQGSASSGPHSLPSTSGVPPEELFEGGPFGEGILPSTLSKTYAGTLGSIVLAGALEYLIMPDMPIRLRYYGCFLFESMLIVVKAKKMSLYEPRQWLPLRLCELYETTRLDGYTRFGWRIVYDQFRIDFGASCEAERQAWMTALQTHIQAAKLAHARLPRDTAALETVVSSLPWNMARPLPPLSVSTLSSSASMGAISGSGSSRQVQVYHQPPSPTPSPWSTCSSAIPSPLMPPPPVVSSSTSSTMMMATSFMTNTNEPEKWNARVTPGVSLDAYAQYYDNNIHPHAYDTASADPHNPSRLALTRHLSVESRDNLLQGFGMAGNRTGTSTFTTGNIDYQDQCYSLLTQPHSQSRTRPTQDPNPHSTRRSESSASGGGGHLLLPSTPFPWLVPNPRPRSHSFDVTKVFASSHSGIKPNQRNLVQSMFKDVSTENIWTTTTAATANHPQPSPQPIPSVSSSSPMTLRAGRYSTSSPFSYFNHSSNSGGSGSLFSTSPKAIVATGGPNPVPSTTTAGGIVGGVAEDDETPVTMPTMQSAGSCSSLTNRFSRRRDSGTSAKSSPSCPTTVPSEKTERDRRRSSATAAFTATLTLNFRKNSDSSSHHLNSTNGNNWHEQRHRRRLSIPDSVTLLFNNNHANNHEPLGAATPPSTRDGIYQRISVKSQAQLIEKKATHGMTPSFASAPSLAPKHKSKKGLVPGKLKSSQSSQDLTSSFVVSSYSTSLTSTLKPDGDLGIGTSLATKTPASEAEADREILNSLSSAAAEAARSRRVASTDKVPLFAIESQIEQFEYAFFGLFACSGFAPQGYCREDLDGGGTVDA
ncbi:hypothetical protein BGX33_010899 [Mortierella sp. NVP41]|nr:hypothetical protein BGX33_010899 [Mortierella sp. NVP41]